MGRYAHGITWWSSMAVCPFFRHVRQQGNWAEIACEGLIPTGTTTATRFTDPQAYENHLEQNCSSFTGCKDCPVYHANSGKYAEDGSLKEVVGCLG